MSSSSQSSSLPSLSSSLAQGYCCCYYQYHHHCCCCYYCWAWALRRWRRRQRAVVRSCWLRGRDEGEAAQCLRPRRAECTASRPLVQERAELRRRGTGSMCVCVCACVRVCECASVCLFLPPFQKTTEYGIGNDGEGGARNFGTSNLDCNCTSAPSGWPSTGSRLGQA